MPTTSKWRGLFASLAEQLRASPGDVAQRTDHIGSTRGLEACSDALGVERDGDVSTFIVGGLTPSERRVLLADD